MSRLRGLFLSHHDGFIAIMEQNFRSLPDMHVDCVKQHMNLGIGSKFISGITPLLPKDIGRVGLSDRSQWNQLTGFPGIIDVQDLRDRFRPVWRGIYKQYFETVTRMCKFHIYDFIVLGLGPFNYTFIRDICPNTPIIYYPRMWSNYLENLYLDYNDDNFYYVMHDEEMEKYAFPCKNKRLIMSSLDPGLYGPYDGSKSSVVTLFQLFHDEWKGLYSKIIDGFSHKLYGIQSPPDWMGSTVIHPKNVSKEASQHRCALVFSRIFSAIATAQLMASGVPCVGYVSKDNELYKYNSGSTMPSDSVDECRDNIQKLLSDHGYAKQVSEKTRSAYYRRHDWNRWKEQWSELITSAVEKRK